MARLLPGMLLGILLFGLLVMGAYMLRLTPEVVNCDRAAERDREGLPGLPWRLTYLPARDRPL